ncbi:hypothetical protein EYF80_024891 [Liparis tanakae]|uniref:Uncharacterized protein n=1 Tax=Liparis tanakae TaxID=230148 RepID=A0A4Z2HIX6_9TELE|nr:hypothetical protein EYF80_024891 [Liparis tanakae]
MLPSPQPISLVALDAEWSDVHHHPPPVALQNPQRPVAPPFTGAAAERPPRLHRLRTEVTGEGRTSGIIRNRAAEDQFDLVSVGQYSVVLAEENIDGSLVVVFQRGSHHQVIEAIAVQIWHGSER